MAKRGVPKIGVPGTPRGDHLVHVKVRVRTAGRALLRQRVAAGWQVLGRMSSSGSAAGLP